MPITFDLLESGPTSKLGAWGPVVAAVYKNGATLEPLKLLDAHQARLLAKYPKIFSFTLIVGDQLVSPSKEVREFSASLQGKYADLVTGAAIVITVRGTGAIIARGFLTAYSLIAPPQMLTKTFKEIGESVAWAQSIPGQLREITSAPPGLLTEGLEQFIKT